MEKNAADFTELVLYVEATVQKAIAQAALVVVKDTIKTLNKGTRTGKPTSRKGKIIHIASAPGEAAKSDTGALAASITTNAINPYHYIVTLHSDYAAYLEFGTIKMYPRPFVMQNIKKAASTAVAILKTLK